MIFGYRISLYRDVGIFIDGKDAILIVGDNTNINRRTELKCEEKIIIGDNCAISWDVTIMDTVYHCIDEHNRTSPVIIGNHVWIGCKSTILKGTVIGDGAVIAAGSVVKGIIPPHSLVGGTCKSAST